MEASDDLSRGRELSEARAWSAAHAALSRADQRSPLAAADLELLAVAAEMTGRRDEAVAALERAHNLHLEHGRVASAVRCAFWVVVSLATRGRTGPASGWLARARRLLDRLEGPTVEEGYLLLPEALEREGAGAFAEAQELAGRAAAIAERFEEADLLALAVHELGLTLLHQGRIGEGLRLLDEAMVTVTSGELSPMVTGLVYCGVIDGCRQVYALRRAREWTEALSRWCAEQPELVTFTGECLVHRAEILQLHGAWRDALEEARSARRRFAEISDPGAAGQALYRQGELHRLRGEFDAAEEAYREASLRGVEPQPGLALLRLAQGDHRAALAATRRAVEEATDGVQRTRVLPAHLEVLLAAGEVSRAREVCGELEELAADYGSDLLDAVVAHSRGAVELADGDPEAALGPLRRAFRAWRDMEAPHEGARTRVLLGLACRALGDHDTARLEVEAARETFRRLEAGPDLARLEALTEQDRTGGTHGLTPRQLEVLRLVAEGHSNRAIAAELVISERTVERHVSDVLLALEVPSRTAAAAYAYEHDLV